jgi:hypothetical protein
MTRFGAPRTGEGALIGLAVPTRLPLRPAAAMMVSRPVLSACFHARMILPLVSIAATTSSAPALPCHGVEPTVCAALKG